MPIPIPAPNSMANHENRPNSGVSPGAPMRRLPDCGSAASTKATSMIAATRYTYHPANVPMMLELAAVSVSFALIGKKIAHRINSDTMTLDGIVTSRLNPS